MAKIYRGTKGNLQFLARRLRSGELVGVPTETVYGLAANALDAAACRKIFTVKGRPSNDPLIVHVGSVEEAKTVAEIGPAARKVMRAFWPGPLTLVLPKKAIVPELVTAGRLSVAVRMPAHPGFRKLLAEAKLPLAAPSANPFGYVSPTTAEHVQDGLGGRIKYILDGGPCEIGVESTIVDLREPKRPRLLRPGQVTREQLEKILKVRVLVGAKAEKPAPGGDGDETGAGLIAPGMLTRHYSPRTAVMGHARLTWGHVVAASSKEAWVFGERPAEATHAKNVFCWADDAAATRAKRGRVRRFRRSRSTLSEVAHNLFALLRKLDGQGWNAIHVEFAPAGGLGDAINDRLTRAAAASGALHI